MACVPRWLKNQTGRHSTARPVSPYSKSVVAVKAVAEKRSRVEHERAGSCAPTKKRPCRFQAEAETPILGQIFSRAHRPHRGLRATQIWRP